MRPHQVSALKERPATELSWVEHVGDCVGKQKLAQFPDTRDYSAGIDAVKKLAHSGRDDVVFAVGRNRGGTDGT